MNIKTEIYEPILIEHNEGRVILTDKELKEIKRIIEEEEND